MRRRTSPLLLVTLSVALVAVTSVAWQRLGTRADDPAVRPLVLVLIDSATKQHLTELIPQYLVDAAANLRSTYGPQVVVEAETLDLESYFPGGAVDEPGHVRLTADVARLLELRRREDGLVGIILIGRIPLPRVYDDRGAHLSLWPWVDVDDPVYALDAGTQRLVRNPKVRDPRAELWSGVMRDAPDALPVVTLQGLLEETPPRGTLEAYLTKNHLASTGRLSYEPRVLFVDTWGEDQMREITVNGVTPPPSQLPGGAELARRQAAERFAQRLVSTGRYDGLNFADDFLSKKNQDDERKTLRELYDHSRDDHPDDVRRWREGSGPVKQIDVASQVIPYFDLWASEQRWRDRLARADELITAMMAPRHPGFDLFNRQGFSFCTDDAPSSGTGYFSLSEEEKDLAAGVSGFASRAELEFVLKWQRIYTPEEKRLSLLRDGVPPYGKYRSIRNTYDVRLVVAPGGTAYELGGARMDGQCFSRGPSSATRGGKIEVLLGAATAAETSRTPTSNLALWDLLSGLPQATVGLLAGPPGDLEIPEDLASMSREEVIALSEKADVPGFGRLASVTGTAEGLGFENDPFLLALLAGVPFGEALRPALDEPVVLYGDPTFHL